jgi:hypothetical protein
MKTETAAKSTPATVNTEKGALPVKARQWWGYGSIIMRLSAFPEPARQQPRVTPRGSANRQNMPGLRAGATARSG